MESPNVKKRMQAINAQVMLQKDIFTLAAQVAQ
jgi:hypothetical protein